MDYTAIQAELLLLHSVTGAYSADDQTATDQLNAVNIIRVKGSMTGQELLEATDSTQFDALTDAKKAQWLALTSHDLINPEAGGVIQSIVIDIFGAGTATVTALNSLRNETVSRAVELGLGTVKIGDIQNARAL